MRIVNLILKNDLNIRVDILSFNKFHISKKFMSR